MADELAGSTVEHSGQVQPEKPRTPEEDAEKAIVDEAIDCFTLAKSVESAQRTAETEELEFEGVDMWKSAHRTSREEHTDEASGRKIPARPTLSVNLLDSHVQQIVTEARQARLALTVKPRAGIANTKTAGYYKGLIRSIQIESGSLEVRLWALERTAKVGRGAYQIVADYANDGDFDIDLTIDRILDQDTVYWDPYAQRADRQDADWCLVGDFMAEEERIRRWPKKPIIPPDGAFENVNDDWFAIETGDGGEGNTKKRRVRVMTYHKVIHTEKVLAYHPQTGPMLLDKMPLEAQLAVKRGDPGVQTRVVDERSVMSYTIDGTQILEQRPWLGRFIPVIATSGKEYLVRGKRRWKGVVSNAMDISRAINVLISSATEIAGTMPRTPYIMFAGQDEGFEEMWDDAPVKNYTRLYVNNVDVDGKPAGLPQKQNMELPIQGLMFLLRMLQEMFHGITGSVPPSSRAVNPYDRSGKAIEALQRQGSAGTSNFLDNLATVSMPYEGRVLVNAIPKYYDRPGRILRVVGEENDDEVSIMIKVPFVRDGDGNPVPVPCPQCAGQGQVRTSRWNPLSPAAICPACRGTKQATKKNMPKEYDGQPVEYVDFGEGEYKVIAAIDRSFQTKQEEALAGMAELAKAAPPLVPSYADLWVRAMGFSGANEIADRIKALNPGAQTDKDKKNIPPEMLAQFQALKAEHDQAMVALQEAQKLLDTDAIKVQGQKEIAAMKAAAQAQLEEVKVQAKVLELGKKQQSAEALEVFRGKLELLVQESQHQHEIILQLLKEKGAKEEERHSVGLHDAAAERAAERAELSADRDLVRGEVSADRQSVRDDKLAGRQSGRDEQSAARQASRDDKSADKQAVRDERSAARQAQREDQNAARAAEREAQKPDDE